MKLLILVLALSPLLVLAWPSSEGSYVETTSGAVVWVPAGGPWPRNAVVPRAPVQQDVRAQGGEFVETTSGDFVWVPLGAPYPRNIVRRKTYARPPSRHQAQAYAPQRYAQPEYAQLQYAQPEYVQEYDMGYQNADPNYYADEEAA